MKRAGTAGIRIEPCEEAADWLSKWRQPATGDVRYAFCGHHLLFPMTVAARPAVASFL